MPKAEHTPGPWALLKRDDAKGYDWYVKTVDRLAGDGSTNHGMTTIASVCGGFGDGSRPAANAHLIAAAPDLYASLKELVKSPNFKSNNMWDRAVAAITKAEKGQPHA